VTVVDKPVPTRRSALFVDFDNVYSGLADIDSRTAEAFGTDPGTWVGALMRGADDEGPFLRRFLIRVCYLNPVTHARYRPFFTRNGFRVVDCPPLTTRQKNSADIHMVLDILDALAHPAHYDEFVVASADADFTPVMQRLRAFDRQTAIVTAGPAAAAYRSVCDSVILPDELAGAVYTRSDTKVIAELAGPDGVPLSKARQKPGSEGAKSASPVPDARAEAVKAAILEAVRTASGPVVTASVAHAALAVDPTLAETGWAGAGKFVSFIARYVPELQYAAKPSPGYLFDPTRHSLEDVPVGPEEPARAQLGLIPAQVSLVTSAPPLTSEQYAVLFDELAAEVEANGFDHRTIKNVRDRAHMREQPIARSAVTFVVQGLTYTGARPKPGMSARELAESWLGYIRGMSANAQMQLNDDDVDEIREWIMSGISSD
jgi:hypothetical protein